MKSTQSDQPEPIPSEGSASITDLQDDDLALDAETLEGSESEESSGVVGGRGCPGTFLHSQGTA